MSDHNIYLPLIVKFFEQDISAASRLLENMKEKEAAFVLQSLSPALAIRVIKNLQISFAAALFATTDDDFLRRISSQLDPHFLSSVLMHLSKESRERIRKHISGKIEVQIRDLFEYPEGSVGRFMTSEFLSFSKNTLAREAINKIRSMAKKRFPSSYAYVVDDEQRLVGVINMRDLMIASPQQTLESIIILTTVTDIMGFLAFLGFAVLFQSYLI